MAGYAVRRVARFLFTAIIARIMGDCFDPKCRRCPRLAAFLDAVKLRHGGYHCLPIAPFGDARAKLLIVGLAPGMHGANRSGRPFTGDHAGIILYATLHRFGLSSAAQSTGLEDGLTLRGVRITNAVKCLPPANKPTPREIRNCNVYLRDELAAGQVRAVLALGTIAHCAVLHALGMRKAAHRFAHGAEHSLDAGRTLIDSYHCSRYNTQTRRLTAPMFEAVVERAAGLAGIG
jgi:uracil-DNA glycosylase family 4